MNQKKVKRIKRLIDFQERIEGKDTSPTTYKYNAANANLGARIDRLGLDQMVRLIGYAPLTCFMDKSCTRYRYKEAKRAG